MTTRVSTFKQQRPYQKLYDVAVEGALRAIISDLYQFIYLFDVLNIYCRYLLSHYYATQNIQLHPLPVPLVVRKTCFWRYVSRFINLAIVQSSSFVSFQKLRFVLAFFVSFSKTPFFILKQYGMNQKTHAEQVFEYRLLLLINS